MSTASKASKGGRPANSSEDGFSEVERAAIKDRAVELKSAARRGRSADKAAADEKDVLAKIAEMGQPDRAVAERLHVIIREVAPELAPKLWYGQPAYARAGKVMCFFRSGQADKERYSSFGFTTEAKLDEEHGLWPTSFALTELSDKGEATIRKLLKKALA
ncbi:iron chaperone [Micromonospora sp. KLBMP9576]|uniref:iron chaperone n=1 Tax=Micromonospora sp. KLBMP9576 TaxID=3424769 RepID=UPI003D936BC6